MNEAVGEATGWILEKPMGAAVGLVPLASNLAQICLGKVAGVGEGISKHEQPVVPVKLPEVRADSTCEAVAKANGVRNRR